MARIPEAAGAAYGTVLLARPLGALRQDARSRAAQVDPRFLRAVLTGKERQLSEGQTSWSKSQPPALPPLRLWMSLG